MELQDCRTVPVENYKDRRVRALSASLIPLRRTGTFQSVILVNQDPRAGAPAPEPEVVATFLLGLCGMRYLPGE